MTKEQRIAMSRIFRELNKTVYMPHNIPAVPITHFAKYNGQRCHINA
jgi:hypothetical protein